MIKISLYGTPLSGENSSVKVSKQPTVPSFVVTFHDAQKFAKLECHKFIFWISLVVYTLNEDP